MIRIMPETQNNLIALQLTGKVDHAEYNLFEQKFHEAVKQHGKVRIYADATGMESVTFSTMWDDLKNLPYYRDVEKFAIVGDKGWEAFAAKATALLVPGEVRYFHASEQVEALVWAKK